MLISKPRWLSHELTKKIKSTNFYSISFHPKEPKLATGASDHSIKIWNSSSLNKELNSSITEEYGIMSSSKRLLATLTGHAGVILCVRFSNIDGRYLASASDDKTVLIWQLDKGNISHTSTNFNIIFGSDELVPNLEDWKVVKRLTGHYMDIVDLSWSPNNRYLATASLDNSVLIYSGITFELIHKIEGCSEFKGISFDPLDRYLAATLANKTAKIFKIGTWEEVIILDGRNFRFTASSIFSRLDWSPNGSHVIFPSVTHCRKYTACSVSTDTWNPELYFSGHLRSVAAVKYNPFLFKQPNDTYAQVLALGGSDNLITIWKTSQREPLVCLKSVFGKPVTDFCWSSDGMILVAVSEEGTSCCMEFTEQELGIPTTYANFSGVPPLKDSHVQSNLINQVSTSKRSVNILRPFRAEQDGKKRFQLRATSNPIISETSPTSTSIENQKTNTTMTSSTSESAIKKSTDTITKSIISISSGTSPTSSSGNGNDNKNRNDKFLSPYFPQQSAMLSTGNSQAANPPQNILTQPSLKSIIPIPNTPNNIKYSPVNCVNISVKIKTQTQANKYSTISCYENRILKWSDILESHCIVYGANERYHCLGFKNQDLIIYNRNGIKIVPIIKLNGVPCLITLKDQYLACLTNIGYLKCWNLDTQLALVDEIPVIHLLNSDKNEYSSNQKIIELGVQGMGAPYISLSSGASYLYNISFKAWTEMTSPFFNKIDLNLNNSAEPLYKRVKLPPIKLKPQLKKTSNIKLDNSLTEVALTSYLEQSFQNSMLFGYDQADIIQNFKLYVACLAIREELVKICDIFKFIFDRQNRILTSEREIIELGLKLYYSTKPIIESKINDIPLIDLKAFINIKLKELERLKLLECSNNDL